MLVLRALALLALAPAPALADEGDVFIGDPATPAALAPVRSALHRAGYTHARVRTLLERRGLLDPGTDAYLLPNKPMLVEERRRRRGSGGRGVPAEEGALAPLVEAFMLRLAVDAGQLHAALGMAARGCLSLTTRGPRQAQRFKAC